MNDERRPARNAVANLTCREDTSASGRTVWRREVACGGNPQRALILALAASPVRRGEVWSFGIAHDDGCPTLTAGGMLACTCELVQVEAKQAA